ncbi:MAG: hypothetical protein K2Q13_03925 [Nitrosomonas sp.]|uniref:hypothetical protein n=1 Tax=Nitrosomonas sp. TaxID=42353 RepID=UPI0025DA6711|nr:hypothetical protein [Nitrosomonas sp.]MBY0474195.1 hypothetical protein [Nitrosomonas sp.]
MRDILSYEERIEGPDRGLINSWYVGRRLALSDPDISVKAKNGELPVLAVKGGVERKINQSKIGSLWYLATWQGLRGDDLDVDLDAEVEMMCSRTGVKVLFTGDIKKLGDI